MRLHIKNMFVYLPPGSDVVIWKRNNDFISKGILEQIACNGHLQVKLSSAAATRGRINMTPEFICDPKRCIRQLGITWIETRDTQLTIPDHEYGLTDLGGGKLRLDSHRNHFLALFFPKIFC